MMTMHKALHSKGDIDKKKEEELPSLRAALMQQPKYSRNTQKGAKKD